MTGNRAGEGRDGLRWRGRTAHKGHDVPVDLAPERIG